MASFPRFVTNPPRAMRLKYTARSSGASPSWLQSAPGVLVRCVASPLSGEEAASFVQCMPTCCISSNFPLAVTFGDEESLAVYQEDETHPAARFPCPCNLQRPLDGRGGDPHPARKGSLTNLDAHTYHVRIPPLPRSLRSVTDLRSLPGVRR